MFNDPVLQKYDSNEYRRFTGKSEFDKVIFTLKGLVQGILLDNIINSNEIEELQHWFLNNKHRINRPPFNDLLPTVERIISNPDKEAIKDIIWLCNNFITENNYYDVITTDMQTLQGIFHGILADNEITDQEVFDLKDWLSKNRHLASIYPYDEVNSLICSILEDNVIEDHEKEMLKAFLGEFVEVTSSFNLNRNELDILKSNFTVDGICIRNPEINIENKLFCFTGKSSRTERSEIANIIIAKGGFFNNGVTSKTNYLVIGDSGNPCWAFACYGRKVEKAVQLRKSGKQILIVHENDFWSTIL